MSIKAWLICILKITKFSRLTLHFIVHSLEMKLFLNLVLLSTTVVAVFSAEKNRKSF